MRWRPNIVHLKQKQHLRFILAALLISIGLSACAPFAPAHRLPDKEMVPSAYSGTAPSSDVVQHWWEAFDDEWSYDGETWQILVQAGDDEPESSVLSKLPNARRVFYVTLEPIGAEPEGYGLLEEVTRGLAKQSGGVWVDPSNNVHAFDEGQFQ